MSIFIIGLYSSLIIGLRNIFSQDTDVMTVSMFVVLIGLMFCHTGAALGSHFRQTRRSVTQGMFCLCFVVSLALIVLGLNNVYTQ